MKPLMKTSQAGKEQTFWPAVIQLGQALLLGGLAIGFMLRVFAQRSRIISVTSLIFHPLFFHQFDFKTLLCYIVIIVTI